MRLGVAHLEYGADWGNVPLGIAAGFVVGDDARLTVQHDRLSKVTPVSREESANEGQRGEKRANTSPSTQHRRILA